MCVGQHEDRAVTEGGVLGGRGKLERDGHGAFDRFDHLVQILEKADRAFGSASPEVREEGLSQGLSAIAALYGSIDPRGSRATAAHLERVYDASLRALSDAYRGDPHALAAATTMARCIRSAVGGSLRRDSRPSRAPTPTSHFSRAA